MAEASQMALAVTDNFSFTGVVGTNAELMAEAARLYLKPGAIVADVTYGKGIFWKRVDTGEYDFRPTDLADGVDLAALPYETSSIDALVLDPPYAPTNGGTMLNDLNDWYKVHSSRSSAASVMALYADGITEAARVLRPKGILFVKCQDGVEKAHRVWSHVHIKNIAEGVGFQTIDQFVLIQGNGKPKMRHQTRQLHARSNHSFLWVFRRLGHPW